MELLEFRQGVLTMWSLIGGTIVTTINEKDVWSVEDSKEAHMGMKKVKEKLCNYIMIIYNL